ncbi:MAG: PAS domain-containing protein [Nitrospirae bacterium]|uniref:sensor histidine kinase n=1 Tax=Candidatus Magnetobacterium casense TaxID=1455061 RepID=UPI0006970A01|nr:ATP-binding protein [Candidatus Magnetobacterium casensis]MBF0337712.1 PAS domain-containing protein [Nitrospirota bacterium]
MNKRQLIRRIVAVNVMTVLLVVVFYAIVTTLTRREFADQNYPEDFPMRVTYVFLGLSLTWDISMVFFFVRHYGQRAKFIKEARQFSEMVLNGVLPGRDFFADYPDLAEAYTSLNDVTRNLMEKFRQTEEERAQLNAIIQSIPDALAILNNRQEIVFLNDKAYELFRYSGTFNNRSLIEVVRSLELLTMLERVKQLDNGEFGEVFLDYPVEKYVRVRMSPFYRGNDLIGVVILLHDITGLKKLEDMRKDFVANVSHEIKTPVTAIYGFAEALLEGAIDDRVTAEKFLRIIKFQSERLNRLVDDLMTLSKIELGVIKINKTEVNIAELIDSVIEIVAIRASEKGLYVKKVTDSDDVSVNADKDRLMQVLLNLADNAIKFTQSGGIEIGTNRDNTGDVYLFVRDTGVGIARRFLSRLGERFFRVDPSRSRQLGGTGLGLAIVKHIVKAHGWQLKIESEDGLGTVVKMLLK